MRKLTFSDMELLINNQKTFSSSHGPNLGIPIISLCYWFSDINKLAEKYDIDFHALPLETSNRYEYYYNSEKSYSVSPRWSTIFWSNNFNDLINLRSQVKSRKLIIFLIVPYNKGFIKRVNFYKETGPLTYFDYLVLNEDFL